MALRKDAILEKPAGQANVVEDLHEIGARSCQQNLDALLFGIVKEMIKMLDSYRVWITEAPQRTRYRIPVRAVSSRIVAKYRANSGAAPKKASPSKSLDEK